MDLVSQIKRVQAHLGITADGVAGPLTWGAISKALGVYEPPPVVDETAVDARSESNIDTLLPVVRPLARSLITLANEKGIFAKITSGYRTYSEQAELYQQGRSKPGKIVTNAPPGYSNHNFALAFDVTIFDHDRPVWESPRYRTLGEIGKSLGLLWGGDWTGPDEPHFEFRPDWAKDMNESQALAEYRERQKNGLALV